MNRFPSAHPRPGSPTVGSLAFQCVARGLLLLALVLAVSTPTARSAPSPSRPNIVVFLVDDMGWQDTSVPFHATQTPSNLRYRTPAMARLAASGLKLTSAYAHCVCTPTRVSLITGINPARHRITNWTLRKDQPSDNPHPSLQIPRWNVNGLSPTPGINATYHTPNVLPQRLRQAGYRTILAGKAHFGAIGTPGADPKNLGFDINIAGHAAGAPGSYLGSRNFGRSTNAHSNSSTDVWAVPGLESYHGSDIFLTEALTLEAVRAVETAVKEQHPFFLYMAHYAVHTPLAADPRFVERYRAAGLDEKEAMYASMIEGMDKSLGDILDTLDRLRVADNTVVIFLSDNGGLSAVARGGKPHTHNLPLASGKGSAREGGIRIPMLVRWPGVTVAGTSTAHPVIVEDLYPTLLRAASLSVPPHPDGPPDGVDLTRLMAGGSIRERPLIWHYPNEWGPQGPGISPHSSIRDGDWKLTYLHTDQHYELYNLRQDVRETTNLADSEPAVRRRLARQLGSHLARMQALMPTNKLTGAVVPYPR